MRIKIRLDGCKDINKFVSIVSAVPEKITIEDDTGLVVNAKSALGVAYSKLEFENIYCCCEKDISNKLSEFMIY